MKLNRIIFVSCISMAFIGVVSVNALTKETIIETKEDTIQENYISGIKSIKYKLEGATKQDWTEYNSSFNITNKGITLITTKVQDNAGNVSYKTSMAKIGDNIELESMSKSGIEKILYKLEGATKQGWTEYSVPFQVSDKGVTIITAKAIDNAGNESEVYSLVKIGEDELNSISGLKSVEYKLEGAINSDWQSYTTPLKLEGNGLLLIMARAIDNAGNVAQDISYVQASVLGVSGIDKIMYKLDGATKQDWTEYENIFTISNNGITTILARAYDKAGNIAFDTSVAKIGLDMSGIDRVEYKLEGAVNQDWTEYTGAFYIEEEGVTTITARAYDKAGNLSQEVTGQVKVDKTSPTNNSIKIELL